MRHHASAERKYKHNVIIDLKTEMCNIEDGRHAVSCYTDLNTGRRRVNDEYNINIDLALHGRESSAFVLSTVKYVKDCIDLTCLAKLD